MWCVCVCVCVSECALLTIQISFIVSSIVNTTFSIKGRSLLNLVMASSISVQVI